MAERAADRAAVADRTISDVRSDSAHRPVRYIGRAAVLDVGMGNAGAKHQLVVAPLSLLQLGQRRDVDDHVRLHQPQIEHRAERLAARDDLGGAAGFDQQRQRFLQVARAFIAERRRFHAVVLFAALAVHRRDDAVGRDRDCINSAPSGRSASLTAL
jgi:hypothetical protein